MFKDRPLWQHIWLEYFAEETPIISHPELLFYPADGYVYFDKNGKKIENSESGDYKYYYTKGRLRIDENSPVPLRLINDLVVKSVANKLTKNEYHYVEVKDRV